MRRSLVILVVLSCVPHGIRRGPARRARRGRRRRNARHRSTSRQLRAGRRARTSIGRRAAALVRVPPRDRGLRARALERTPRCAIAYWGIALSYWGNPFAGAALDGRVGRGLAAVAKGQNDRLADARERAHTSTPSPRCSTNYSTVSQRDRILAYERGMAEVVRANPQDIEATDLPRARPEPDCAARPTRRTRRNWARRRFSSRCSRRYPDHPGLAHYIIHAYDHPPLARARSPPRAATPRSRRRRRMRCTCRRTRSRASELGRNPWTTNRLSEQTALRQGVATEALHAMDYQTYAHLQMAQDRAARDVLDRLPRASRPSSIRRRPRAARRRRWRASTRSPRFLRATRSSAARGKSRALAVPRAARRSRSRSRISRARSAPRAAAVRPRQAATSAALAALRDQLTQAQDAYWAEQVDIQWRVAGAWVAFAEGRRDEALDAMRVAADSEDATDKSAVSPGPLAPARELLGEMLLEAGDAAGAFAGIRGVDGQGARAFPRRIRRRARGRSGRRRGESARVLRAHGRNRARRRFAAAELERARNYLASAR